MTSLQVIGWIVLLASAVGFIAMGVDKRRAQRDEWRIRERTLFLIALCGGSPGVLLGMSVFRHKTKHLSFVIGIPAILAVQAVLVVLFAL